MTDVLLRACLSSRMLFILLPPVNVTTSLSVLDAVGPTAMFGAPN